MWVLFVILVNLGYSSNSHFYTVDFGGQELCETARQAVTALDRNVEAVCVKR